jgi:alkyl sulfatase BDS1-like metallo-beta-lactamase superfamily hydrolase
VVDLIRLSERVLAGERPSEFTHPFDPLFDLGEVADGVAMVSGFANVAAIRRGGRLTLVDVGSWLTAVPGHELVRRWSKDPLERAIFTHGHVDHVMGLGPFVDEVGTRTFEVVAHRRTPERFARYAKTAGWNGCINQRQFSMPVRWPTTYPAIDRLVDDALTVTLADGAPLELHHDRGETDDHLWAFLPDRRVLFTGDLFIWAFPNAGNPQKVQRYPDAWAAALRKMASKKPAALLPGHGLPIVGEAAVERALVETADALESIVEQVVALMNEGADLDAIVHAVKLPPGTLERPYLRPVYDDPSFVVRTVWRLYGGWWDQDPATLLPAPKDALARELAALAGGAEALRARAEALMASDLRLATHLVELARRAAPDDEAVAAARREIYRRRAEAEPSLMAKGIFGAAAK